MNDTQIIDLYWTRSERAIEESDGKYGHYCHTIAYNILSNDEDSEECVSDTWLRAWNAMPPQRPSRLKAFFGKITRNLSLDCFDRRHAEKRGAGQTEAALEELQDCLPARGGEEQVIERMVLTETLNRFLKELKPEARNIFLRRYWYMSSVGEIARDFHISESKVKMTLHRTRGKLKDILEKEGALL